MANINDSLDDIMKIEGAFATALVDYESGMTLGTRSSNAGFDIEVAASGNTQVVRSKMAVMESLGIGGGMLIANPVPRNDEIPADEMNIHIEAALRRAESEGVAGKAVTPFLLSAIVEATGGRSLATNIALVRNNARLAAEIAVALAKDASVRASGQ